MVEHSKECNKIKNDLISSIPVRSFIQNKNIKFLKKISIENNVFLINI